MPFSKNAESTVVLFLIDQRMTLNWNVVGVAKFAIQNRHCYAIYIYIYKTTVLIAIILKEFLYQLVKTR